MYGKFCHQSALCLLSFWFVVSTSTTAEAALPPRQIQDLRVSIAGGPGQAQVHFTTPLRVGTCPDGNSAASAARSCKDILDTGNSVGDGVYWLDPDGETGPTAPFSAYCDMTSDGGGWTLVFKIDGNKTTFSYDAALWTNQNTLNPTAVAPDTTEAKLPGFLSMPFTELRLGITVSGTTNWKTLSYSASSLYSIFSSNTYIATSVGRNYWKGLINGSSLQPNCNKEGFNVAGPGASVRLGMINNQENDCNSPDSRLGFGGSGTNCGQDGSNSCGNSAYCSGDNGNQNIKGFGMIWVRHSSLPPVDCALGAGVGEFEVFMHAVPFRLDETWTIGELADFERGAGTGTTTAPASSSLTLASGVTNGTWISEEWDAGESSVPTTLSWTASVPVGSTVGLYVRTSEDLVTWSPWSGPYVNAAGSELTVSAGRYVQVQVAMTSGGIAPTLTKVTMAFAPSLETPTLVTTAPAIGKAGDPVSVDIPLLLPGGKLYFAVRAVNPEGTAGPTSASAIWDDTSPVVEITSPADAATVSSVVTVHVAASSPVGVGTVELIVDGVSVDVTSVESEHGRFSPEDYRYWRQVTLTAGGEAVTGLDTVTLVTDFSQLQLAGMVDASRHTWRLARASTTEVWEMDRLVSGNNTAFRPQATVLVGGSDSKYRVYYGYDKDLSLLSLPMTDPEAVYLLWDDFEDGNSEDWQPVDGSWSVTTVAGQTAMVRAATAELLPTTLKAWKLRSLFSATPANFALAADLYSPVAATPASPGLYFRAPTDVSYDSVWLKPNGATSLLQSGWATNNTWTNGSSAGISAYPGNWRRVEVSVKASSYSATVQNVASLSAVATHSATGGFGLWDLGDAAPSANIAAFDNIALRRLPTSDPKLSVGPRMLRSEAALAAPRKYQLYWDTSGAEPGPHTLEVVVVTPLGQTTSVERTVVVVQPTLEPPAITSPKTATTRTTPQVDVVGWAPAGTTVSVYANDIFAKSAVAVPAVGGTIEAENPLADLLDTVVSGDSIGLASGKLTGSWTSPWISAGDTNQLLSLQTQHTLDGGTISVEFSVQEGIWLPEAQFSQTVPANHQIRFRVSLARSDIAKNPTLDSLTWTGHGQGGTLGGAFFANDVPLPQGTVTLVAIAEDGEGTTSEASNPVTITVDSEAPAAIVDLTAAPGTNHGEVVLTWTAPADVGLNPTVAAYEIRYNQGPITKTAWPYLGVANGPTPLAPGSVQTATITGLDPTKSYTVAVRAKDASGLFAALSNQPTSVPKDGQAPSVSVSAPANNAIFKGSQTFSATASDNVGVTKVEFYVDNNLLVTDTVSPYQTTLDSTTLTDGTHTLKVVAYDAFNNSTLAAITVTTDNTQPTITIDPPTSPTASAVTLTYTIADNITPTANLVVKDQSAKVPPFTYQTEGPNTITLTVTDAAGNSKSATTNFLIDKTGPAAITNLTASPVGDGTTVQLNFTAPADALTSVASYELFYTTSLGDTGLSGTDGALTVSTNPYVLPMLATALVGDVQAGATVVSVVNGVGLSGGDEVFLYGVTGPSAGIYETAVVLQSGPDSITFKSPLVNDYNGTGGAVSITRVPHFTTVTVVSGGVLTTAPWDGVKGGVLIFRADSVTVQPGGKIVADGIGYRGFPTNLYQCGKQYAGKAGESYPGWTQPAQTLANGTGGGGGGHVCGQNDKAGGGGGGHATAGGTGATYGCQPGGQGGGVVGTADLAKMYFGGAGGQGAADEDGGAPGYGGKGGGIVYILAETITNQGAISANGGTGGNGCNGCGGCGGSGCGMSGGGGGAGGSIYLSATTLNTTGGTMAIAGAAGGGSNGCGTAGANGGSGRIRLDAQSLVGADAIVAYKSTPSSSGLSGLVQVLDGIVAPAAPGTTQTILVSNLDPNLSYFFVIRSRDVVQNPSPMSNVASVDGEAPTVSITYPEAAAVLTRPLEVTALAGDSVGLAEVRFYVDDVLVATDTLAPYGFTWDIRDWPNGEHVVRATAEDVSGQTLDHEITVTLANEPPSPPVITSPLDGTDIATSPIAVTGTAEALTAVELSMDGVVVATVPVSGTKTAKQEAEQLGNTLVNLALTPEKTGLMLTAGQLTGSVTYTPIVLPGIGFVGGFTADGTSGGGTLTHQFFAARTVFSDSFDGGVVDPGAWIGAGVSLSGGAAKVTGTGAWGNQYLWGNAKFARTSDTVVTGRFVLSGTGNRHAMVGFKNSGTGTNYTDMPHAIYFDNGAMRVYEDGNNRGQFGTFVFDTAYDWRIQLKATGGAVYSLKLATASNWTQLYDSTYSSATDLRVGVVVYSGVGSLDNVVVRAPVWSPIAELSAVDVNAQNLTLRTTLTRAAAGDISPTIDRVSLLYPTASTTAGSGLWQVPQVAVSEGIHTLTAVSVDEIGTSAVSNIVIINLDNGPAEPIGDLQATSLPGGSVVLSWSAPTDQPVVSYAVYRATTAGINPGTLLPVASVVSPGYVDTPTTSGTFYYVVQSVDEVGNISDVSNEVSAIADGVKPTLTITLAPASPVGAGVTTVTATVLEPLSSGPVLAWTLGGVVTPVVLEPTTTANQYTGMIEILSTTPSGTATFSWTGTDIIGNTQGVILTTPTFVVDTSPPTVAITSAPGSPWGLGNHTVTLTANENLLEAPVLTFNLPNAESVPVVLSGSGKIWTGQFVVAADTPNGTATWQVVATDMLNNVGNVITSGGSVVIDTVPPGTPGNVVAIGGIGGVVTITWVAASGGPIANYRLYRSNSPISDISGLLPIKAGITGLTTTDLPGTGGEYYYAVTAVDTALNEGLPGISAAAISDQVPPGNPIGLLANIAGNSVQLTWIAPGGEAVAQYRIYRATTPFGGSVAGKTPLKTVGSVTSTTDVPTSDGNYRYVVTAVDLVGNESMPSNEVLVAYDKAPPTIVVNGTTDGQFHNTNVVLEVTITDLTLQSSSVLLNGAPYANGQPITADGAYSLVVNATDGGGLQSSKTVQFSIDKTPPIVTVSGVVGGAAYEDYVTPTFSATDTNLQSVSAKLNGVAFASGTTIVADGSWSLVVTAVDKANNTTVKTTNFTLNHVPDALDWIQVDVDVPTDTVSIVWPDSDETDVVLYQVLVNGELWIETAQNTTTIPGLPEPGAAFVYEVRGIDTSSNIGQPTQVMVNALAATTDPAQSDPNGAPLVRGYFDTLGLYVENQSMTSVGVQKLTLALGTGSGEPQWAADGSGFVVDAGQTADVDRVLFTPTTLPSMAVLNLTVEVLTGGASTVRWFYELPVAVRWPAKPPVRVASTPLQKGIASVATLEIENQGTATMQIRTAATGGGNAGLKARLLDLDLGQLVSISVSDVSTPVIGGYHVVSLAPGQTYQSTQFILPISAAATPVLITEGQTGTVGHDLQGLALMGAALVAQRALCPAGYTTMDGTAGDDTLVGTAGDDCIVGYAGNDVIRGFGGNDLIIGGPGNDQIYGELGDDILVGGGDDDELMGGSGNDLLLGGLGADYLVGDGGWDLISPGDGLDVVFGGVGQDTVLSSNGTDQVDGGVGTDHCDGVGCEISSAQAQTVCCRLLAGVSPQTEGASPGQCAAAWGTLRTGTECSQICCGYAAGTKTVLTAGSCAMTAGANVGAAATCVSTCSVSTGFPRIDVCNNTDDDCNGKKDDAFVNLGQACDGPDADLCTTGNTVCDGSTMWTTCAETGAGKSEWCNSVDDDCDGLVDEGFNVGMACDGGDADVCTNGVTVCDVGSNTVLQFDGINDYVHMYNMNLSVLTEATVEAWVRFDDFSQFWSRVVDFGAQEQSFLVAHAATTNTLAFHFYSTAGKKIIEVPNALVANKWTHVAATCGPKGMQLFMDGVLKGTVNYTGCFDQLPSHANYYIGRSNWAVDGYLKGAVAGVRISNKQRYNGSFVPAPLEIETDTVSLWMLSENKGLVAYDSGPTQKNARIYGASWLTLGAPGIVSCDEPIMTPALDGCDPGDDDCDGQTDEDCVCGVEGCQPAETTPCGTAMTDPCGDVCPYVGSLCDAGQLCNGVGCGVPGSITHPVKSCLHLLQTDPGAESGTRWLDPDGGAPDNAFEAYCDMDIAGGGWTTFYVNYNKTQWATVSANLFDNFDINTGVVPTPALVGTAGFDPSAVGIEFSQLAVVYSGSFKAASTCVSDWNYIGNATELPGDKTLLGETSGQALVWDDAGDPTIQTWCTDQAGEGDSIGINQSFCAPYNYSGGWTTTGGGANNICGGSVNPNTDLGLRLMVR